MVDVLPPGVLLFIGLPLLACTAALVLRRHVEPRPRDLLLVTLFLSVLNAGAGLMWLLAGIGSLGGAAFSGAMLGGLASLRFYSLADRLTSRCGACGYDLPLSSRVHGSAACSECGSDHVEIRGYHARREHRIPHAILIAGQASLALVLAGGIVIATTTMF